MANGNIIKPNLRATLKISNKLSSKGQSAQVSKEITTGSLISMGKLYDDDYIAIFTKFDVKMNIPSTQLHHDFLDNIHPKQ